MPIQHIVVVKAGKWLMTQAGVALFDIMKQRLVENMGLSAKQPSLADEQALLDTYLNRFEERLAQKIIDRLDEDRLAKLNSAISQLKMASRTSLKQGYLESAASKFFDIASLPDPGTTAGIPNAQLRSLAYLGIAAIHLEVNEVASENLAAAILADIPTAKLWFGEDIVQKFIAQSPELRAAVSALPLPPPLVLRSNGQPSPGASAPRSAHMARIGTVYVKYEGHRDGILSVTWSPDGSRIASLSIKDNPLRGAVRVWNATTGKELFQYDWTDTHAREVVWSPDGARLAFGKYLGDVEVWEGVKHVFSTPPSNTAMGVTWSPDARYIASSHARTAQNSPLVRVWDSQTGKLQFTCEGHTDSARTVAWSPDGTRIASGSFDKTVRIWRSFSLGVYGLQVALLSGHTDRLWRVIWSPDSSRIASSSDDKTVRIWDVASGRTLLVYHGHGDRVYGLAWSPDGTRIVSGSKDKTAQVWDAQTGKRLYTYRDHRDAVLGVSWSPDGARIASSSMSVHVWQAV